MCGKVVAQNKFVIFETEKKKTRKKMKTKTTPQNKVENTKFHVESSFESLCPKKMKVS